MRNYLVGASLAFVVSLSACGGSDETPEPNDGGNGGVVESGGATEDPALVPTTEVVTCELSDGLPVAEVRVENTTDQASAFSVEVQFLDGQTVLGTGLEFTQTLQPGQDQTISMGNMQGDADAVDTCEVIEAVPME